MSRGASTFNFKGAVDMRGCRLPAAGKRSSGGLEVRSSHTSTLPRAIEMHGSDACGRLKPRDPSDPSNVTRDEFIALYISIVVIVIIDAISIVTATVKMDTYDQTRSR